MITYVVYGITDCPACLRACALLMERDLQYSFSQSDFSCDFRQHLKIKYDQKTFPIIIEVSLSEDYESTEKVIGGYDDLILMLKDNTDEFT